MTGEVKGSGMLAADIATAYVKVLLIFCMLFHCISRNTHLNSWLLLASFFQGKSRLLQQDVCRKGCGNGMKQPASYDHSISGEQANE